jgi:hypothetical protein
MATCTITATEFKDMFDRGPWAFSPTLPDVRDKDINEAIAEAEAVFNSDLYPDEATCKQALSYLTAHFLTMDLDMYDTGGQAVNNVTSRSAHGISESVQIPEEFQSGPLAIFATTAFGQKWLMLSIPYTKGSIDVAPGDTTP